LAFRREEFLRLLARLRGRVTLSYSCYDIGRDRELFPSPTLVAAYRILAGEPEGDLAGMRRWLGPPASFGPADPAQALDESEWWLARVCAQERRGDVRAAVGAFYPHLRRGLKAEETRGGTDFTAYDGFVPAAGAAHAPDRPGAEPLSAHRLETIGTCPRRYFYYYVLGLTLPPETKPDEDAWLDPPTLGTLLHEVFRAFIGGLGRAPDKTRDRETLARVLDAHIAKYRELYPPVSAAVFEEQKADLYKVTWYFLGGEDKHGADHTPRYVEVALGLPPTASGSPLDCRDALSIRLPDGRVIRGRGKIDRLDERADGAWEIWDYKTGKLGKYGNKQPYNQGRVIQHAFYLELVRSRLSAAGLSIPPPTRFGFFFPGLTEKGTRVVYDADGLADGLRVIALLCDVVARGAFVATDSPGECDYCDYQPICGGEPAAVGEKLAACTSPALAPLKELRSGDKKAAD
jgi:hypothetical protein